MPRKVPCQPETDVDGRLELAATRAKEEEVYLLEFFFVEIVNIMFTLFTFSDYSLALQAL